MTRWVIAAGLVAVASIGCGKSVVPVEPAEQPAVLDRDKLDHASLLLRGRRVEAAEWQRWSGRDTPLEQIVDSMLDDGFVYREIAPALIFRNNLLRRARVMRIDGYDLVSSVIEGQPVFHLDDKCKLADTVMVNPWWDPAHPVRVCKQIVRETVWEVALADGTMQTCNVQLAAPRRLPGSPCGCGPNLVRCLPPGFARNLPPQLMEEVRATTALVASTDQPLARLFTMNETWRSRDVELFYLRQIVHTKRIQDPEPLFRAAADWPATGKLAPREEGEPGQHAGVLTAPQIVYHVFDPRQRMRIIYEAMWCSGESAPGARPEDLLSLRSANLSTLNEGWRELAGRPVCTNCHARLDYGMQFFHGYRAPDSVSYHYVAGESPGATGPLYTHDIRDLRGSARLTPAGFAELATQQPEFARCLASDVAEYVFGSRTAPETIERLARSAPPTELRFRPMLRLAILEFLHCDTCRSPGGEIAAASGRPAPATARPLATLVGDDCTACHNDSSDGIPDFERQLDRRTRLQAMDQAVFGRMPPGGPLSPAARREFVAAVLGHDVAGGVRKSPTALVLGHADPPPALPLAVARQYLRSLDGRAAGTSDLNTLEMALAGRDSILTPNNIALIAVEASRSCASAPPSRQAECIQAALDGVWGPASR